MTMTICVTQCPAGDAMEMCAIVRLRSCFDSTDVQLGNRLLNWPKLLRLYADGFYSIFVPECVPYIIPHKFQ